MCKQLMKDNCEIHKGSRFDYLCVDSNEKQMFKCMYCVTDDNPNQLSLIPIEQILNADSKTVFANFPLKDRDLTREIKSIAACPPTGLYIKQQIESFFKEFRAKFIDRLDSIKQNMTEKAQSISDFGELLISNYNHISSKEHLQSIIADQQKTIEDKSSELKDICAEALSKNEENNQLFSGLINSMNNLQQAIDFETPKLISESIIKHLENINIFLVDDIAQFQQQLLPFPQNLLSQQPQQPTQNAISNLMKLIRNKTNDVSVESCAQLEQSLNRFSVVINQLQVPVPGPLYECYQRLDQEEHSIFTQLINEVDSMRNTNLPGGGEEKGGQKQMQENQNDNIQTEKMKANQIIELVNNKANFCSAEFIEDFSKVMKTIEGLLGLFSVRKSNNKSEQCDVFNRLNQKQLEDFTKLAVQVNILTSKHQDQFLLSQQPQSHIQPNSYLLKRIISDHSLLKHSTNEERERIEREISSLFVQYPIAELLPQFKFFKLLPMSFTKTKYKQSSEMAIAMNGNEVELTFPNCNRRVGQAVTEILKNESGYLLRLKFNRPYGKHAQGQFRIGLIPNSEIDSNHVLPLNQSGFCSYLNNGAKLVIKGGQLSSEPIRSVITEVEFRWCIEKRQFFISDSNYSNINQAEENHFNSAEIYRFGIDFHGIKEGDWKVTITEFQELDPAEVTRFD